MLPSMANTLKLRKQVTATKNLSGMMNSESTGLMSIKNRSIKPCKSH